MRKRLANIEETSDVDMTPMLDIVFIMLIFFIVTTSFIKESGITIDRPSGEPSGDKTPKSILVKITELEDVVLGDRVINPDSVQANVEVALSKQPDLSVVVKVSESADSGLLVSVVDQVKLAGIKQVTVSNLIE